jgi:glycerol dehydrogenase
MGNALPSLPETHGYLHGEKVSFGLMTQLCLDEGLDADIVEDTAEFLATAGLPVTFADINIDKIAEPRLREFANGVAGEGSFVHNHNFKVTGSDIYDAMTAADDLGRRTKAALGK